MTSRSLILLAVAACGGTPPAKPQPKQVADFAPMCKRIFARKATCADDYLPILLDVRLSLNKPPGIAERVQSDGRDAILATARTELARDTEPARVGALCETAAAQAKQAPPERRDGLFAQAARCEAAADCKAFAVCVAEIDRGFIAAGP